MGTVNAAKPPLVAAEYAREVRNRLGNHVRQIILFGSQARGEGNDRSDYDFIVVVDKRTPALREAVLDAGGKLLDDREELCAALLYDETEWERTRRSPLGWNVEREGVPL